MRQRTVCALGLAAICLASVYTAIALLSRVYPALFPGKSLPSNPILAPLDEIPIGISNPDETSVFNQRINVLVAAIDKRPGTPPENDVNSRADAIMVATVDPLQGTLSLLSFSRDFLVTINPPGEKGYEDRINASYTAGLKRGRTPEAGVKQLETDIEANFGIAINHCVLLDFLGVAELIDAVGGIEVDIPAELAVKDWLYSDDDVTGVWLNFPPGPTTMDGYRAVAFSRYRETDSDLQRVKRHAKSGPRRHRAHAARFTGHVVSAFGP